MHNVYQVYTVGWAGVGWQRRCKTRQSLRELYNQGSVFCLFVFFCGRHGWRSSQIRYAGWRALTTYKGNNRITQCDSVYYQVYGGEP